VCDNLIDDDCDGLVDEACPGNFANDAPGGAPVIQYSVNMNYPNCYPISGNNTLANNSTESAAFNGPDSWYRFVAQSTGVTITMTSTTMDDAIALYSRNGLVYTLIASEDASIGAGDFERLNFNGLTIGQTYYVSAGASSGLGGSFPLCIQNLMPSGCSYTEPVGGFNLCNNWKATYRGAPSNGVTYTFNFTGVGGNAAAPFATTTLSGTNGLITLSNPALGLRYGGEYDASVDVVYTLLSSAGATEVLTVSGATTGNCNDVTIMAIPAMEVFASQRCPATLLRSNWLRAARVNANAAACGVTNYTYEFTQIANATACAGGTAVGLPTTFNTAGNSPYLQMGVLPIGLNSGVWDVRVRANFGSGASAYSSDYGPIQRIQVAGTSASGELLYEIVDAEKDMTAIISSVSLYPNPASGEFVNVSINNLEKGQLQVRVLDAAGRVVTTRTYAVEGSLNTMIAFDDKLSAGVYMIEMVNSGNIQTMRMLVE
jgi:hypothetical protein